jgi:methylsterol monooxygenase
MAFVNCFSTSFRWWDFTLGTDAKYHAYKARVAKAKASEREAVNAREMERAEREGLEAERLVVAYGKPKKA